MPVAQAVGLLGAKASYNIGHIKEFILQLTISVALATRQGKKYLIL